MDPSSIKKVILQGMRDGTNLQETLQNVIKIIEQFENRNETHSATGSENFLTKVPAKCVVH